MNFNATIRELEEKRDFYAAAIEALKKIAVHEAGQTPVVKTRKPGSGWHGARTPEERARLSEIAKARWAKRRANQQAGQEQSGSNGTQPHTEAIA